MDVSYSVNSLNMSIYKLICASIVIQFVSHAKDQVNLIVLHVKFLIYLKIINALIQYYQGDGLVQIQILNLVKFCFFLNYVTLLA